MTDEATFTTDEATVLAELRSQLELIILLGRGWIQHSTCGSRACPQAGRVVAHL